MPETRQYIPMSNFRRFISSYFQNSDVRFNVGVLFGLVLNVGYIVFNLVLGIMSENVWYISVSAYYTLIVVLRYMLIGDSGENTGQIYAKTVGTLITVLFLPMTGIIIYTVLTDRFLLSQRAPIVVFALYAAFGIMRALYGILFSKRKEAAAYRMAHFIRLSLALISLFNFQISLISMLSINRRIALTLNFITGGSVSFSMLLLAKISGKGDLP